MASVVEGFMAVAGAVRDVAANAKMAAVSLTEATAAAEKYTAAAKEAITTTSMVPKASGGGSGTLTIATSDLGDPRNAEEQMARMIESIDKAKRR